MPVASFSMRSLHKIYEPPIPKHLIPTNNPFYNKKIFSPQTAQAVSQSGFILNEGHAIANSLPAYNEYEEKRSTTPRSLLKWINSSNTKKVQKRMTNRIQYLKQLSLQKGEGAIAASLGYDDHIETKDETPSRAARLGFKSPLTMGAKSTRPLSSNNQGKRNRDYQEQMTSSNIRSTEGTTKIFSNFPRTSEGGDFQEAMKLSNIRIESNGRAVEQHR